MQIGPHGTVQFLRPSTKHRGPHGAGGEHAWQIPQCWWRVMQCGPHNADSGPRNMDLTVLAVSTHGRFHNAGSWSCNVDPTMLAVGPVIWTPQCWRWATHSRLHSSPYTSNLPQHFFINPPTLPCLSSFAIGASVKPPSKYSSLIL